MEGNCESNEEMRVMEMGEERERKGDCYNIGGVSEIGRKGRRGEETKKEKERRLVGGGGRTVAWIFGYFKILSKNLEAQNLLTQYLCL